MSLRNLQKAIDAFAVYAARGGNQALTDLTPVQQLQVMLCRRKPTYTQGDARLVVLVRNVTALWGSMEAPSNPGLVGNALMAVCEFCTVHKLDFETVAQGELDGVLSWTTVEQDILPVSEACAVVSSLMQLHLDSHHYGQQNIFALMYRLIRVLAFVAFQSCDLDAGTLFMEHVETMLEDQDKLEKIK